MTPGFDPGVFASGVDFSGHDPWKFGSIHIESAYMHTLGNFFEHDFGRATANGVHARIPYHTFDGALSHESHPAVELQAGVHDLVNKLATVSLHHRNFSGCFNSAPRQPGCMEDKLPPSLNPGGQHRQSMTDRLFRPQR
jgi:hypothetical protein